MNKLEEYVLKYKGIHNGTDDYLAADAKPYKNENLGNDISKKLVFDGSQLGKKLPLYIQHVIDNKKRAITLLDYGCGQAIHTYIPLSAHGDKTLFGRFNGMIQCYYSYDPAVEKYAIKPPTGMVFDVTCCADVMEHVPEEFVPYVLTEIGSYTKDDGVMLFTISANPAKKYFKDGENLHITLKPLDWWVESIKKYCGDKSFVLIHDDQQRINGRIEDGGVRVPGTNKYNLCTTWIRYYNSPLFSVWNDDIVSQSYHALVNVGETK